MYKAAFIPITPFKIKDKDEYYSETGVMKRNTNRSLSTITGATTGALAGMAIGTLAGQMLGKRHPGLFDGNVDRYLDTAKKTGFHPAKQFIESYIREHGVKPTKIPVELHAPIAGLVFGSVAGALPAEHMAMRKMEKRVGIEPTTGKEYLKKEVTPCAAGATASLIASDVLYQLSGKYPKLLSGSINESTIPVVSGAVYTAAKNVSKNMLDDKRKGEGDKEMVIRQKLAALAAYGGISKVAVKSPDSESILDKLPGVVKTEKPTNPLLDKLLPKPNPTVPTKNSPMMQRMRRHAIY